MAKMNEAMNNLMKYNASILPRKRSAFNRSHSHSTTFDSAYLIPIMIEPILPSDFMSLDVDSLVRMATPFHPTMDSAYLDIFAFYAPYRLLFDDAKAFFGENLDAEYNDLGEYEIPSYYSEAITPLEDYMGISPCYTNIGTQLAMPYKMSILPFRFYQRTWNEWFRASEIQPSVQMNYGSTVTQAEKSVVFQLRKAGKLHDYFTSALPRPQAGDAVFLPLSGSLPVVSQDAGHSGNILGPGVRVVSPGSHSSDFVLGVPANSGPGFTEYLRAMEAPQDSISDYSNRVNFANLVARLDNSTALTISNLRNAITIQQLLELDALGGSRYSSIMKAHFGVLTPDDVLQRVQFLGTVRTEIGMRTVAQTSGSTEDNYLGELGAFSATRVDREPLISQAFTEPGYVMVLACVRPLHTYSQGIPWHFTALSRFDHYWPVFDGVSNQPIFTKELCAWSEADNDFVPEDRVFGYKPAWEQYRVALNRVSGLMRPNVPNNLATWNYADYYREAPILNGEFIEEDENLIDRTIAVQNEPQFIGDFHFNLYHERPIGARGIPGLTRF